MKRIQDTLSEIDMIHNIFNKINLPNYSYPQEFNDYYEEIMPRLPLTPMFFNDNIEPCYDLKIIVIKESDKGINLPFEIVQKNNLNSSKVQLEKVLLITTDTTSNVKENTVRIYTRSEIKEKIKRWKEKKKRFTNRNTANYRYEVRQIYAKTRPRIGGRFVPQDVENKLRKIRNFCQ
jgi:ribosomal protein L21